MGPRPSKTDDRCSTPLELRREDPARVAQGIARQTSNLNAGGSNPSTGTDDDPRLTAFRRWQEHLLSCRRCVVAFARHRPEAEMCVVGHWLAVEATGDLPC